MTARFCNLNYTKEPGCDTLVWEIAVHLAVACGVYGDVFLCCPFSHEVSWMRS